MNNLPIGVLDSGIGGLTILKEIVRELLEFFIRALKRIFKYNAKDVYEL